MMGCSVGDIDCNADERPIHQVQITKPFQIGKFEVTQAQWQAVMGSNPSTIRGDDRPVETISKDEAHEFLNRLNARNDGFRYRLPTEAEWEYAARAGTATSYTGKLDDVAWYNGNSEDETHPVGQKKPNAWGLYDMEGNVKEWVEDLLLRNLLQQQSRGRSDWSPRWTRRWSWWTRQARRPSGGRPWRLRRASWWTIWRTSAGCAAGCAA